MAGVAILQSSLPRDRSRPIQSEGAASDGHAEKKHQVREKEVCRTIRNLAL